MKAGLNTASICTILLHCGKPYMVVNYNKERTVWFLAEYKGKFDFFDCVSFPRDLNDYNLELPL